MPEFIQQFLEFNVALAPVIFIVIRTLSIIIAPIPATPLDLVSIALFGKVAGFIYTEISILVGGSIAFFIAKSFGEPVVGRFIPIDKIRHWIDKIERSSGFMTLIALRFITQPIFDYLSYVIGLMKMKLAKFFTISLLGSASAMAIFFYFGGLFLEKQLYLALGISVVMVAFSILIRHGKIFKKFSDYFQISNSWGKINEYLNGNNK